MDRRLLLSVLVISLSGLVNNGYSDLLVHCKFDETGGAIAYDSSGHSYDGEVRLVSTNALINTAWDPSGYDGSGCINFDGDVKVVVPPEAFSGVDSAITVSLWVNGDPDVQPDADWGMAFHGGNPSNDRLLLAHIPTGDGEVMFESGALNAQRVSWEAATSADWAGQWNHYVFTLDSVEEIARIYHNGEKVAENNAASLGVSGIASLHVGCGIFASGRTYEYFGKIDDFRVYDYALSSAEVEGLVRFPLASAPYPPDNAEDVPCDVVLNWSPGDYATSHDVYLGTDFDNVSNADTTTTLGVYKDNQEPNSYDPPADLELGTTYYWRIDEVGDANVWKGDVWSFTVADAYINSLGMRLICIQPGTFAMGSENGDFDERPVHNVTISQPFCMSKYEVTNAQYEQFDPNHKFINHRGFSGQPDEAVIFVSWEDANAFCEWLSQKEGLPYRLPTEAEWEYACRAETTTQYYTGDTLPAEYQKNAEETSGPYPVPLFVGQTPPNPWGFYDMHGNVEEWCYDWYGPYEVAEQTDPVGRVNGRFRVSRGGSHSTPIDYLRSANRMGTLPEDKHWLIGFRVVMGQLPTTQPLPEPPPELYQTGVGQEVPPDIKDGPDPNVPYFEGPRTYVKIPPGSYGPLFSAHNHDPALTECPNGDLLAIWYTCIREKGRELAVAASRLRYGQKEWEQASPFWDAPDRNDHCPAMWTDENGKIYHFAGLADAATWGALAVVLRTSTDNGVSWSRARLIIPEHAKRHMPAESVFRTSGGSIILPCDANPGTAIWVSDDNGQTWYDPGGTIAGIHAGVVELNDGRLMAFGRGDNIDGRMPKSISNDMGRTWTYSASEFPPISGGQRVVLRRLKEGPILFVSFTGTSGMVINEQRVYGMFAALSYDEGETWPVKKLVTAGGPARALDGGGNTGWFVMDDTHAEPRGYLAAAQTPDGVIQLISSALHYRFNLAWLEHKDLLVVDDFEAYTTEGGGNPIFDTWRDGRSDPDNGALVDLETAIVHGGDQAMRIEYGNGWPYCKAVRTYLVPQDWTENDLKGLSLWFRGEAGNDANDQMYAVLKDADGDSAAMTYDGDANSVQQQQWQEWNIDLQDFNDGGVNLTDVNVIAVGVSGSSNGVLYFDDIRLYPTRCIPKYRPPGDISGDCITDTADLEIVAGEWLKADEFVSVVAPAPPVVHYQFNEASGTTVVDNSDNGYAGTFFTDVDQTPAQISGRMDPGRDGNSFHFSARIEHGGISMPSTIFSDNGISQQITISLWLKNAHPDETPDSGAFMWEFREWDGTSADGGPRVLAVEVTDIGNSYGFRDDAASLWYEHGWYQHTEWRHYAFVRDAETLRIYVDGFPQTEGSSSGTAMAVPGLLYIGISADRAPGNTSGLHDGFTGNMDDWQIYSYALSQEEVLHVATDSTGYIPVVSPANIYDHERPGYRAVNFKDYAVLASSWLEKNLWPLP